MAPSRPDSQLVPPPSDEAQLGSSVRLVEHLARVGVLRTPADCHFFYCSLEMARFGDVRVDQLLTNLSHRISDLRYVCYYVLENQAGMSQAAIAQRFGRRRYAVLIGVRHVRDALRSPAQFAHLVQLAHQLTDSFTHYKNRPQHG